MVMYVMNELKWNLKQLVKEITEDSVVYEKNGARVYSQK